MMGKTKKIVPYTVGELIAELEKFPKHLKVYYGNQAWEAGLDKSPSGLNTIVLAKEADGSNERLLIGV
jgi:hypothetical protein